MTTTAKRIFTTNDLTWEFLEHIISDAQERQREILLLSDEELDNPIGNLLSAELAVLDVASVASGASQPYTNARTPALRSRAAACDALVQYLNMREDGKPGIPDAMRMESRAPTHDLVALPSVPERRIAWAECQVERGGKKITLAGVHVATFLEVEDMHNPAAALRVLEGNLLAALADVRNLRRYHEAEDAAIRDGNAYPLRP